MPPLLRHCYMAQNHLYSRDHPSILPAVNSMSATLASSVAACRNALVPLTLGRSANTIELLVPIAPVVHGATAIQEARLEILTLCLELRPLVLPITPDTSNR